MTQVMRMVLVKGIRKMKVKVKLDLAVLVDMPFTKTPSVFLSSPHPGLPSCFCYSPPSQSCASCRPSPPHLHLHTRTRTYAQHASGSSSDPASRLHSSTHPHTHHSQSHCDNADLSWPVPIHPHQTPTPYQILATKRGDLYTKHRFYSLAKLYHPDSRSTSSPVAHLPLTTRVERYRLLVAAHQILSDDSKRRAYDLWGAGWVGHQHNPNDPSASSMHWKPEQRSWPSGHDPMNNATWEDWERWYDREYNRGQTDDARTVHLSRFGFVSLVFALVSLGGIMQGTRANMFSSTVIEHRDKVHKEASMELMKAKRASMANGDRNERIKTFLEHREATLMGEDAYQRILPPTETCAPESVRKQ
ncbi:hypothetical protein BU24DRAFT_413381 [Aaosphaeria arxii CBS 175.79]|uniref:J domain-containing protein n=1 Tax=Aaosphaeria arxii CBS 175.79 TaxID=1450172 RepID=A0A6A5XG05_9PLEO|nr:uncharacterized protein BU24DRAFT_413381 [Aaosphaeria arxii CBS 175.79]KAF2011761.1 hypothetical protein BU24DRAFT_413381 [Aaosphaeria arxii CBS 175.79]